MQRRCNLSKPPLQEDPNKPGCQSLPNVPAMHPSTLDLCASSRFVTETCPRSLNNVGIEDVTAGTLKVSFSVSDMVSFYFDRSQFTIQVGKEGE